MFGYIYETTNLINGKKYIGQKKSNIFLGNKYLGSGTRLHLAIEKYGEENFIVNLIEECNSEQELNEREIYWIDFYNATASEKYYNISIGGDGGDTTSHNPNKNEIIQKRTNKLKGRIFITNGDEEKHVLKEEADSYLSNGWRKGRSNETIRQMKENHTREFKTGWHHSEETKAILSKKCSGWHHSEETKKKIAEANKVKHYTHGKKFMNNGILEKQIPKNKIDEYLNLGFVMGRLKRNR